MEHIKISLIGREAENFMVVKDLLMQAIYPPKQCGPWEPDSVIFVTEEAIANASKKAASSKPAAAHLFKVHLL